jgi:hypothetical protein
MIWSDIGDRKYGASAGPLAYRGALVSEIGTLRIYRGRGDERFAFVLQRRAESVALSLAGASVLAHCIAQWSGGWDKNVPAAPPSDCMELEPLRTVWWLSGHLGSVLLGCVGVALDVLVEAALVEAAEKGSVNDESRD